MPQTPTPDEIIERAKVAALDPRYTWGQPTGPCDEIVHRLIVRETRKADAGMLRRRAAIEDREALAYSEGGEPINVACSRWAAQVLRVVAAAIEREGE